MAHYLHAMLWNIDTYIQGKGHDGNAVKTMSQSQRLQLLGDVVTAGSKAFFGGPDIEYREKDKEYNVFGATTVFIAPEYYFAKSDRAHAIDEGEKRTLVTQLEDLSMKTATLLVPGSIAWKKSVVRTGNRRFKGGWDKLGEKTSDRAEKLRKRILEDLNIRVQLLSEGIDRTRRKEGHDLDKMDNVQARKEIEHRAELLKLNKTNRIKETETLLDRLANALKSDRPRVFAARNTAYAFNIGSEVGRYHKRGDYHEVVEEESDGGFVFYMPGLGSIDHSKDKDRFSIDDVDFGLEICLDHVMGYLSLSGGKAVDVHLLMSAQAAVNAEHAHIKDGGYLLHASSAAQYTQAYQRRGNTLYPVPLMTKAMKIGTLHYGILKVG